MEPLNKCELITLPKIFDTRGNLTFIEGNHHVPFPIERIYFLYDVPGGSERAGHAHKNLNQLIIAISGSFDIHLDDGHSKKTLTLNRPFIGLRLVPGIWRTIDNFSSGAVCLVLASTNFDAADYCRYKAIASAA